MIAKRYQSLTAPPMVLDNFLGISFDTSKPVGRRVSVPQPGTRPQPHTSTVPQQAVSETGAAQSPPADHRKAEARPSDSRDDRSVRDKQMSDLETLLTREREQNRRLTQELLNARSALKRADEVQAELAVEQEAGKLLVQFLEEAEQEARKVSVLEARLQEREKPGQTPMSAT
jgi:hypothetical protein